MVFPSALGPDDLKPEDFEWSRGLCNAMITAALEMVESEDGSDEPTKDVYASVRSLALDVRTDDFLGAERWLLTMFLLSARTVGVLKSLAQYQGVSPETAWQMIVSATPSS
jgi:hypothetical protein